MIRRTIILSLFLLLSAQLCIGQRIGLVLSGGGAKGLTHIGVIRALEENGIPIDYVAGTSMGAIIGSLYAMGYSPDEMKALIKSDDFKRWYTGTVDEDYSFYFKKNDATPEALSVQIRLGDSIEVISPLPTNIINPIQMNLGMLSLFTQAGTVSKNNFDSLFIPFRCVASDVYNKEKVVFKNGDLGKSVRASMSFPFVFKPIMIDSTILYDGGIYDNFPVQAMIDDFAPDYLIGSVVAKNPSAIKEGDIMNQLENLIMEKSIYNIPDSLGITLTFNFDNVNLLDFDRIEEFEKKGYDYTMTLIDSIRQKVHRELKADSLQAERDKFKERMPKLLFKKITVSGVSPIQKEYVINEFRHNEEGVFTFEELKESYFSLLSGDIISSIYPSAIYNPTDSTYDLHLDVELENNISIQMGGSISSENTNQIYWGGIYRNLGKHYKEVVLNGQLGRIYNNVQLLGRMDFSLDIPLSLKVLLSHSSYKYYRDDNIFSFDDVSAINKKQEDFIKIRVALPFLKKQKAEFGLGLANISDRYIQNRLQQYGYRFDESKNQVFGGIVKFGGNTLNSRLYATSGRFESLSAEIFTGTEWYYPNSNNKSEEKEKEVQSWLQFSYTIENYLKISQHWVMGGYLKTYFSSRNFAQNYQATIMETGVFAPTPNSRLIFDEDLRANQYAALGIKPIYKINDFIHLRGELYGFMPVYPILEDKENKAYYGEFLSRFYYMGELSVVAKFSSLCLTGYVNYYGTSNKDFNIGLTFGWLMFGEKFFE